MAYALLVVPYMATSSAVLSSSQKHIDTQNKKGLNFSSSRRECELRRKGPFHISYLLSAKFLFFIEARIQPAL